MRELKFRAWDKENKHMAYSDKHEWDYNFSFDGKSGNLACAINCCYCDTFGDEHDDWNELDNTMQYTGLKDKNNKEIYEGDIVSLDSLDGFVVEYDVENARFILNGEHKDKDYGHCGFHLYAQKEIEVIGNIYENPELLQC